MKRRLSITRNSPKFLALAIAFAVAVPLAATGQGLFPVPAHRQRSGPADGVVYAMNNAASGNRVLTFRRASDGSLRPGSSVSTGGYGSGTNLGSQGALALSDDGHWLLAVNAASNTVSVFLVNGNFLLRTDTQRSGGDHPISVAENNGIVYVLNAGSDNVQGFRLDLFGRLDPIANSIHSLGAPGTGAAEVDFNRAGDLLAVTEKATNEILTWAVDGDGTLGPVTINHSLTPTPYGFAFGRRDQMLVSDANAPGGPTAPVQGGGVLSSYQLTGSAGASPITASLADHQTAPCWVVVTRQGRYAFTSNTASNNISSYGVADDGQLTLLAPVATNTGDAPLDLALDRGDQHLYALDGGSSSIGAYGVGADGSLRLIQTQPSAQLTNAATGLVAR
ncbi:MAG: beta-propeller fold lactonase family protein [Rhodanobacter sp.]